jgi:2-keto-4-pentenoate hydratase/2-oxohepta-3-ene-1,7-dioic acid hydratase in catechol pathway
MRFVSFTEQGTVRAGVLTGAGDDRIVDLAHPAMRGALPGVDPTLLALIEAGLPRAVDGIAAHGLAEDAQLPVAAVTLEAPLPEPRRVFGFAHNYRDALAERDMAPPDEPVLFTKGGHTVIGDGQAIVLPPDAGGITYEAELAVVIGTRADAVGRRDALDHVVAYGCFNDISASEVIKADGSFDRGKNFATFGPFGPFLASRDEIDDPHALAVSLRVDGRVLQSGSTRDMLFDVAELVAYLSAREVLEPGDVIATGTPAGVAALHDPPAWLRPGSTVEVEVEGLGRLSNPVVQGASSSSLDQAA